MVLHRCKTETKKCKKVSTRNFPKEEIYGFKFKGGGGKGTSGPLAQYKKHFECWTKTRQDLPEGAQEPIQRALSAELIGVPTRQAGKR